MSSLEISVLREISALIVSTRTVIAHEPLLAFRCQFQNTVLELEPVEIRWVFLGYHPIRVMHL